MPLRHDAPEGATDLAGNAWVPDEPANRTLTVLPNGPDLVVSDFRIDPNRPTSGDTATFTVTIDNVGSQPASGLTLDLDGQDAFGLFPFDPGGGWSCNQLPERVALDIRCSAPQVTLAAGAQTTVRLETRADPEIRADLPSTGTAHVALSPGQEIDTSNNRRSVSGTVTNTDAGANLDHTGAIPRRRLDARPIVVTIASVVPIASTDGQGRNTRPHDRNTCSHDHHAATDASRHRATWLSALPGGSPSRSRRRRCRPGPRWHRRRSVTQLSILVPGQAHGKDPRPTSVTSR